MDKVRQFIHSIWYYVLVIAVTVIFHSLSLGIVGLGVLALLISAVLIVDDDFAPVMVTMGACVYVLNEYPITDIYYIVFGACLALVLPSIAYFIYKNIKKGVRFSLGKYFLPLVLIVVAYSLGGIFSPYYNIGSFGFGVVISVVVLCCYLLLYNFNKSSFKDLAFHLISVVSIIIILEMWVDYFTSGDILALMQNKGVRVGVGEINLPAMTIGMWIPLLLAKGLNNKKDYLYVLTAVFALLNVVFTFSRGALLFTLIFGLVSLIIFYIKTEKKKNVSITVGSVLVVGAVLFAIFYSNIIGMLMHYIERGFDDTGRFELYQLAIQYFSEYPIFGVGWQVDTYSFIFSQFHSTPLQFLASMGVVGFLLMVPHYYQRYSTFLTKPNVYSMFLLMSVLICEGYGFIDQTCTFSMSYIYIIIFMLASDDKRLNTMNEKEKINTQ